MLVVPAQAIPNQQLAVGLNGQAVQLNIYQFSVGLFMDVYVGGTLVIAGVICQNLNRIVRSAYLGVVGDFAWLDTQGTEDPNFTGIGTRWLLLYLDPADLAASGFDA